MSQKIVIVGATSGIAEHCARLWAVERPTHFVLLGRSAERLERVADDLRARGAAGTVVETQVADFLDPQAIAAVVDQTVAQGLPDIVLVAHGSLPPQQQCQTDLVCCADALQVNGVSPVLFAQAFAAYMEKADAGTLALISSVAGDRGRKTNYIYGAAKSMLSACAQGMQHRFAGKNVRVVLVKPGPTDTPMTAHLRSEGGGAGMARAEDVAADIVRACGSHARAEVYTPGKWRLIMWVIRHLPRCVFNRLNI